MVLRGNDDAVNADPIRRRTSALRPDALAEKSRSYRLLWLQDHGARRPAVFERVVRVSYVG